MCTVLYTLHPDDDVWPVEVWSATGNYYQTGKGPNCDWAEPYSFHGTPPPLVEKICKTGQTIVEMKTHIKQALVLRRRNHVRVSG
jgi:hypothetical protein